ncbi:MAG: hypothetical protein EAX86_04755 [Candidatus Heimdallarchaeota archaeon]|nr:hypothetical protein [Candidatus Heimdallarchaeota archaeon]
MDSNTSIELNSGEKVPQKTTWIDVIFIILLVNLGLVILVSIVAIIFNSEFLESLLLIGVISGAVYIVVILLVLLLSIAPPALIRRIFHWEEEKEANLIVNLLFLLSFLFGTGTAIGLYILILPYFPVVADPFSLTAINPVFAILYSIWWFFGFIISILIITILYLLLETGRYA